MIVWTFCCEFCENFENDSGEKKKLFLVCMEKKKSYNNGCLLKGNAKEMIKLQRKQHKKKTKEKGKNYARYPENKII